MDVQRPGQTVPASTVGTAARVPGSQAAEPRSVVSGDALGRQTQIRRSPNAAVVAGVIGGATPPKTTSATGPGHPKSPVRATPGETTDSVTAGRSTHAGGSKSAIPLHQATSAAEARQAVVDLLLPVGTGSNAFGKIERVGIGAESYGLRIDPLSSGIKRLLAENRDLETAALAGLSEPDRQRYATVATCLADRPASVLALQLLLIEGGFAETAGPATDGKSLLQTLDDVASGKTKLAASLDKDGILADIVHELAFPSAINQSTKATCTVTSMQIMMAKYRPAEYARVVAGLVSESGEVTLADGHTARRTPATELPDSSSRTTTSRVFEAAMMEFANGPGYCYDNDADRSENAKGDTYMGAGLSDVQSATAALIGATGTVQSVRIGNTPQQFGNYSIQIKTDVLARISATLAAGNPVLVSFKSTAPPDPAHPETHDRHEVLLVGATADNVQILNPWGLEETLSWADASRMLETATFVTLNERAAPASSPDAENQPADVPVVRAEPLPPAVLPKFVMPPAELTLPRELVTPKPDATQVDANDGPDEDVPVSREPLEPLPEPRQAPLTLPAVELVTPQLPLPASPSAILASPPQRTVHPSAFSSMLHAAKTAFDKITGLF